MKKFNRFLYRNRDKGIPNLMTWLCAAAAIVYLYNTFNTKLVDVLEFNAALILQGQVWRLFTYVFTFACGRSFLFSGLLGAIISLLFYHWIGRVLEMYWGRFHLNLYYLTGLILMDVFGLIMYLIFRINVPVSSDYINTSLFLAVATLIPEERIYLYAIIPIKMRWLAVLDLVLMAVQVVSLLRIFVPLYKPLLGVLGAVLMCLFPLVGLLNYFIFFGSGFLRLFPNFKAAARAQKRRAEFHRAKTEIERMEPNPEWAKNYRSAEGKKPYRHKCTVCGRTDTECPGLEFRYCSKCSGYFCYCIDHINNHTHIQ